MTPGRKAVVEIVENTFCVGIRHLSDLDLKDKIKNYSLWQTIFFWMLSFFTLVGFCVTLYTGELIMDY